MGLLSQLQKVARMSAVDESIARDFDTALDLGRNRAARRALLKEDRGVEHGMYSRDSGLGEIGTSRSSEEILPEDMPSLPRGYGDFYFHHTHPIDQAVADYGYVQPLSIQDLNALRAMSQSRFNVKGMFAHETEGGGSFAAPGIRAAHKGYGDALDSGFDAASDALFSSLPKQAQPLADFYALMATGAAAKRKGLLSKYGYRPSREGQAETMDLLSARLDRAEKAALRAMHKPIYGLPYPLSYGRLALAGAGLGGGTLAAYEALR